MTAMGLRMYSKIAFMVRKTKNTTESKAPKEFLAMDISFGGPSMSQKVLFAKNLSVMLRAGMTLVDALKTIEDSLSGKFRRAIADVRKKVESGMPFSKSVAAYPNIFPDVFVNVAEAGESSGTLAQNLEQIAGQLKKDKDLVTKVRGAMIYPAIILVATFGLGLAISFLILPQIVPLFQGLDVELPLTTRALIAFSALVEERGMTLFAAITAAVAGLVWLLRRRFMRPATHWILVNAPIVKKIVRHTNVARFAGTLGVSLKSGISIDEALEITRKSVNNHYYQRALLRVSKRVRAGSKLSDELLHNETLFPPMLVRMLAVGEESGKLEDTLAYVSDFYESEVDTSLKTLTTLIEPLLLLFIGTVVGLFALSIITPIYDITGNVQQ